MSQSHIFPIPGFSEPVSSLSHLVGAVVFLIASIYLYRKGKGNELRVMSLLLFSFFLVFLMSMSGVYHLLDSGHLGKIVLRRLDHAAIWTMIAGTFTPIHIMLFRRWWRWGFLGIVWAISITGLVLTTIFFTSIPEWASLGMYVGLGWMGVLSAFKMVKMYGKKNMNLVVLGGILYTIGGVLDFLKWPVVISGVVEAHELFHFFVLGGALCHWRFIYYWANIPIQNHLTFHVVEKLGDQVYGSAKEDFIELSAPTVEELTKKIQEEVEKRSNPYYPVQSIRLCFFKEQTLYLG